jgi:hypothetical protein
MKQPRGARIGDWPLQKGLTGNWTDSGVIMTEQTPYTTRVYQYGAVPLGPFPEEGVEFLYKSNALWNKLVEIHNDSLEETNVVRSDKGTKHAHCHFGSWSD